MMQNSRFSGWFVLPLALFALSSPTIAQDCTTAEGWWSISDADFVDKYECLATGTQLQRGQFAWMMFARVNQTAVSENGLTFTDWELWASDPETFVPNPRWPDSKPRTGPELKEARKQISARGSEEVMRNETAFNYIKKRGLNTAAGVNTIVREKSRVEFTLASVEVKAHWAQGNKIQPGMYQILDDTGTNYGLDGMHIMVKIDIPNDPSTDHSWFWATFEYMDNPGRDSALKFITYPDEYGKDNGTALLRLAGVDPRFSNYLLNGTQIDFVQPGTDEPVILGNTTMEAAFAVPRNAPPALWTTWNSSCHSCHFRASENAAEGNPFFGNPAATGNTSPPPAGYWLLDFDWGIPFNAGG